MTLADWREELTGMVAKLVFKMIEKLKKRNGGTSVVETPLLCALDLLYRTLCVCSSTRRRKLDRRTLRPRRRYGFALKGRQLSQLHVNAFRGAILDRQPPAAASALQRPLLVVGSQRSLWFLERLLGRLE